MAEEEIPRDVRWAIPLALIAAAITALFWYWDQPTPLALGFMAAGMAAVMGLLYLGLSYSGPKSRLYGLKPLSSRLPAIAQPKGHVHFRTKKFWTILVVLMYFLLTNYNDSCLARGTFNQIIDQTPNHITSEERRVMKEGI